MKTRIMSRIWNIVVSFVFLACLISANIASAYTIDFGVNAQAGSNPAGTFMWSPGDILSISGIEVDAVSVLGDSDSVLTLTDAQLDLMGMHFTGFQSYGPYDLYFFDASGTIMIGGVPAQSTNKAGDIVTYNNPLMSGDLTGLVAVFPNGNGLVVNPSPFILAGSAIDEKNEKLLQELGLLDQNYDASSELLVGPFAAQINLSFDWDPQQEKFVVGSGDVLNTPVPIPGAIVLLGGGLLGLIGIRRSRLSR